MIYTNKTHTKKNRTDGCPERCGSWVEVAGGLAALAGWGFYAEAQEGPIFTCFICSKAPLCYEVNRLYPFLISQILEWCI